MSKVWKTAESDLPTAGKLAAELGIPEAAARVLAARGYRDPAAAARFLDPRLDDLSDPFALPDMARAVDRIWKAIESGERIVVFGDYDVDGITGTALLVHVLRALGARVEPFLPNRTDDGYGLETATLRKCVEQQQPGLVITVDCGTGSTESVRWAGEHGVDVVVSDHHEVTGVVAPACAVLNPQVGGLRELSALAGVGVAFKLCHALVKRGRTERRAGAGRMDLRAYLDWVALGTIADVVPLVGENRILARHGLERLGRTSWEGLVALKEVSGLAGEVDAYHVGFVLGPRLNAAGRLGDALAALELLLTDNAARAREIAVELDRTNRERQAVERSILEGAIEQAEKYCRGAKPFALVLEERGWHPGVIGIVASRVSQRYHRPTILLAVEEGESEARGSGRSIEGFDLVRGLEECADLLVRFGGHAMAAGLDIRVTDIGRFRQRFNDVAAKTLGGTDLRPVQPVDAWIDLAEADEQLLAAMERMQPFGLGNRTPVWAVRGVRVVGEPRRLKEKHWKMTVAAGRRQAEAIGFNLGHRELPSGPMDVAFHLELNSYMGRKTLQLNLQDFRPAEDASADA